MGWQTLDKSIKFKQEELGRGLCKYRVLWIQSSYTFRYFILVRDGFVVKVMAENRRAKLYVSTILHSMGLKDRIQARDRGSLYKKAKITKKARNLLNRKAIPTPHCRNIRILGITNPDRQRQLIESKTGQTGLLVWNKKKQYRALIDFVGWNRFIQWCNMGHSPYVFVDSARMLEDIRNRAPDIEIPKLRIEDLHDWLSKELYRLRTVNQKIPYKQEHRELIEQLNNTIDYYTTVLPEDTHTMCDWGRELHHCLGSYTDDAMRPNINLYLGIYKNSKLVFNVELSTKHLHIRQFCGSCNHAPPRELREKFDEALEKVRRSRKSNSKQQASLSGASQR